MLFLRPLLALLLSYHLSVVNAKVLWSSKPATNYTALLQHAYPVGNGRLAILPYGEPGADKLSLNRDNLWSGGPFANSSYRGGNPIHEKHHYLPGIRDFIWKNGTGNVTKLMGNVHDYGSYQVLGNVSITVDDSGNARNYKRVLDLETGVHTTTFKSGKASFEVKIYCSYPDDVCVYEISSTHSLPAVKVSMEQIQERASLISTSCVTGGVRLSGKTEVDPGHDPAIGMKFEAITRAVGVGTPWQCEDGVLKIPKGGHKSLSFVIAAGTDYEETHGDAAHQYSFRGEDPEQYVQSTVNAASAKTAASLLSAHIEDYAALSNAFTLTLPDPLNSATKETANLISNYNNPNTTSIGDPYLESLVFDYGRHLFISSGRQNSLPPNLQGKWANALLNAWSADYHVDVNLQMNQWPVVQTGLGPLQQGLWDYMADTWAPRGAETAKLLYNAPGFVVHDEVNIFGYSAMKTGDADWANYPASAAWMCQHVWDYFDYYQDVAWLKVQGYAKLLKPVAEFWLSQLQEDQYFKDGTLVVNPCDSPEHGPTTFGCTHWQQLIYQVFETTLASAAVVGESDTAFLSKIHSSLATLDKGLHIGRWGQIQEWKLDIDVKNDTHRHLSNLIGWFPGWSLSSYLGGYTNKTIQKAVATTLWSRGVGIADSNAGWEKVWRSACWARLNETDMAYYELRLTIFNNWAPNALSMYSGHLLPFQIDANFGFPGAVLSMLVVDLPQLDEDKGVRTVVLGPAIPAAWGGGSVKGLRIRGGGTVDFKWDVQGIVTEAVLSDRTTAVKVVNRNGTLLAEKK